MKKMPDWFKIQLRRAFYEKNLDAVIVLNEQWFSYLEAKEDHEI